MKKEFIILSLSDIFPASAAIMVDGEVVAATHEERFTRIRGDMGFPLRSAMFCMETAGLKPEDIDVVAILDEAKDLDSVVNILFKRAALYSIKDWLLEQKSYWIPKLIQKKKIKSAFKVMGGMDRIPEHHYNLEDFDPDGPPKKTVSQFNEIRKAVVQQKLGVPKGRVLFMPHEMSHHYHAYYSNPNRGDNTVILYADGIYGSSSCGVSIPKETGLSRIGGLDLPDQCGAFQWAALHLGMKPYFHEQKVLELSPYCSEYEKQRALDRLASILSNDPETLALTYDQSPSQLYHTFREKLEGCRFDGVAGAIQQLFEKQVLTWAATILEKTQRTEVRFTGSLASNPKINGTLSQMDPVTNLITPLAPGDESLVIGAAYMLTEKNFLEQGRPLDQISPLKSPYLGSGFNREEVMDSISNYSADDLFVYENVDTMEIAGLLAQGKIIAVSRGRCEFGSEGLGNRSILAHPSNYNIKNKLSSQTRTTDFWLPFHAILLEEAADRALKNPKNLPGEFFQTAFPINSKYEERLKNVIHPGNNTVQPHILKRDSNPKMHDLLVKFKQRTGFGGLLNKTFNLHGEPMVNSPDDALEAFVRSNLDGVLLEDVLVSRSENLIP